MKHNQSIIILMLTCSILLGLSVNASDHLVMDPDVPGEAEFPLANLTSLNLENNPIPRAIKEDVKTKMAQRGCTVLF